MGRLLGCNTLYLDGRLTDARRQFTFDAHRKTLQRLRETGFDACEFSHYDVLVPHECEALRKECDKLGIRPWSAHSWVTLPAHTHNAVEKMHMLCASVDAAADLGVSVLVVHAAGTGLDMSDSKLRHERTLALETCLLGAMPHAVTAGIQLAIENCGTAEDLEFLVEAVNRLDLPGLGFCLDTGHAQLHGIAPAEAARLMGKRLFTTHLQDNHGRRDEHLPPGAGTIDWPETLRALKEIRYPGVFMVEISDAPPGREPDAAGDMQTAYENMKKFLAAAS